MTSTLDEIERRLIAMADDPPLRFVDTTRAEAERFLAKLRTFSGYTETEIASAEQRLRIAFPPAYRDFLLRMGRARGELFCGSDVAGLADLEVFRDRARKLLARTELKLPGDAIVFLFHQGYAFTFLRAHEPTAPTEAFNEGERAFAVGPTFEALLESEVAAMEEGHRRAHASGGTYISITGSGTRQWRPARNTGDRPLDHPHRFRP